MASFRMFIHDHLYILPILGALLTMFTLPPYNWPWFAFGGLTLLGLSIRLAASAKEAALYGTLFAFFFSGYVTYNVLSGFHWFAGAEIFVWFMFAIGVCIVIIASILSAIASYLFFLYKSAASINIFIVAVIFTSVDVLINFLLSNFNYGSLQYVVALLPGSVWLSHYLPVQILVFLVFLANVAMVAFLTTKKKYFLIIPIVVIGFFVTDVALVLSPAVPVGQTVRVALIQSQERDTNIVFGKTVDGVFTAPHLAGLIEKAALQHPDVIVYPFNPWVGAMIEDGVVANFDRDIIAVRESVFTDWVATHVPKDVVFVTWYTAYRGGAFYNEIGYWQNGVSLGVYQKQKLFPFFDYTPAWAQSISLYSTPFDGSSGLYPATPVVYDGMNFGNIICSEITSNTAVKQSMLGADVLFSIGSEAMFTNELPAAFNFLKARSHASTYRTPVVRATKLGPSGVFDEYGHILGRLPYGADGVLVVDIPLTKNRGF